VNLATPTASVGGEPLKAYLVRDRVPLDLGLASVVADKTSMVIGQAAFLGGGLPWPSPPSTLQGSVRSHGRPARGRDDRPWVGSSSCSFVEAWRERAASSTGSVWALPPTTDPAPRRGRPAHESLPPTLEARRRLGDPPCGRLGGGGLEIYVVVSLAGIPVDLATSFVLEALSTAVRFRNLH